MLLEEAEKRSGLRWPVRAGKANGSSVTIYAALQQRWKSLEGRAAALEVLRSSPGAEGYTIRADRTAMDNGSRSAEQMNEVCFLVSESSFVR